jgi:hypothetical protein
MGTFNGGMFNDVGTFDNVGTFDVGILDDGETFEDVESPKGPGMFEAPRMLGSVATSAKEASSASVDLKVEGNMAWFLPGQQHCSGSYTSVSTQHIYIYEKVKHTSLIGGPGFP